MSRDLFPDRERSLEEQYARERDAELIQKLREKARLEEISAALAAQLAVSDPALLQRVRDLGVTADTAPAFLLAPLVQVAWAEGAVAPRERETVLRLAEQRGVAAGSPAHAQLAAWLDRRPADALFDAAAEVVHAGFAVLPPAEREERVRAYVSAMRTVAESAGGLGKLLGLATGVSPDEATVVQQVARTLRGTQG